MTHLVTITSQGQISIPAQIRRDLNLDKNKKVSVSRDKNRIIIEPVVDILTLGGSLNKYAKKGLSIDEIMRLESEAGEKEAVERYKKSLRK